MRSVSFITTKMEPLPSFKVPANVDGIEEQDEDQAHVFHDRVNAISQQVVKLEKKVHEIEQFYSNARRKQVLDSKNSWLREKDKGRASTGRQNQQDSRAASMRMQDLMNQFQIIMNQITQRKGVCSSLDSEDVDGLGLHDFPEVSGKPKDLNCVRKRMEAKDGSGYTHVRDIYADVRLVLKNAMKRNNPKSDAHVTAKTLLAKFEEKWLRILPNIMREEERREDQGLTQETYHAQMAKDVSYELYKVDHWLRKLGECVLQRHRKMSTLEKREIGRALTKLSADDLTKALEIVAQENPSLNLIAGEVDLDIDTQSEYTLWRLKHFIVQTLRTRGNNQSNSQGGEKKDKRKGETGDAFVKPPAKKKAKKVASNT